MINNEVYLLITPELYELEYLFECEAILNEEGIPWQYASVAFKLIRGKLKVEFELEKASSCGQLSLYFEEENLSKLSLENIHAIRIKRDNMLEYLIVEFEKGNYVLPLELQTKPSISISWGTSLELQR